MLRIHSLPARFVRRAHAWELFQETGRQLGGAEAEARKMADGQTRQP